MSKHIIWDWNCTLFDDFSAILAATTAASLALGGGEVDVEMYHKHHQRPLSKMGDSMFGRVLTQDEQTLSRETFEGVYLKLQHDALINAEALDALNMVVDSGATQSVLSMRDTESVTDMVNRFELGKFFIYVHGVPIGTPQVKKNFVEEHIKEVSTRTGLEFDRSDVTLIGDCVDDAHAAESAGINCVLFPFGLDSRANIESAGHPVAESLIEAVKLV